MDFHCLYKKHLALTTASCGNWMGDAYSITLTVTFAVNSKLSFISNPHTSCISTNIYKTDWLTCYCKQDEISDALTVPDLMV